MLFIGQVSIDILEKNNKEYWLKGPNFGLPMKEAVFLKAVQFQNA
jgi:hypothetical protein